MFVGGAFGVGVGGSEGENDVDGSALGRRLGPNEGWRDTLGNEDG